METVKETAIIETEIVCSKNDLHTYELTKRIKGAKGDKATIILLYPTRNRYNLHSKDSTLNHLVTHMQELGLSELRVINIFSQVFEGKLSAKGLEVDEENLAYIDKHMADKSFRDNKFIIAWGSSMATSYAVNLSKAKILDLFKEHCARTKAYQLITSDNNIYVDYAHPLFLGIRCSGEKWSLEPISVKSDTIKISDGKATNKAIQKEDFEVIEM